MSQPVSPEVDARGLSRAVGVYLKGLRFYAEKSVLFVLHLQELSRYCRIGHGDGPSLVSFSLLDLFETVQGAYSTLLDYKNSWYLRNLDKSIISQCVVAAYINYKKLPCIAMLRQNVDFTFIFDGDFVFFTEKDKVHIIKEALKISLEDIIDNALNENVIDERTLKSMLYKNYIIRLPAEEFIQTSVEYIDNIVQAKIKWKNMCRAVEDEDKWLEETR